MTIFLLFYFILFTIVCKNCILDHADRIDSSTIRADRTNTTSSTSVKIIWKEPEGSNGPIVAYQLEYKKVGDHVRLNKFVL